MRLSTFLTHLENLNSLEFKLYDGTIVPAHFHLTEIGISQRHFIDCGGTERKESRINMQLWYSTDADHRLTIDKLKQIIVASKQRLDLPDEEIEIAYQSDTIGLYNLEHHNGIFVLSQKNTDCLAQDSCGIPQEKPRMKLSELIAQQNSREPGSGCC